jgi:serine/threonine-protein kinase
MSKDEQVQSLLLRWGELREQGQSVAAEELCRDYPGLVDEVRQKIAALQAVYRVPNGGVPATASGPGSSEQVVRTTDVGKVDGYEILGELGQGGMGVVYKARQSKLQRLVALKMILAGAHASTRDAARFRAEAEAVARLQYPNIVQIYEIGEQDGCPYLALEYVDGISLAQRLSGAPLPSRQAAHLTHTLAQAVHYAHQRGVVHRDLKPANVLLTKGGTPKITDFGLAKRLDTEGGQTQTGNILGTPGYMAPEQAEGRTRAVGPHTDVHALGALLYEMLTGRPPFQGATLLDTLEQVRSQEPVPPGHFHARLPPDLETICLKCLRKEPAQRYASAADLADDLQRYLDGEAIAARTLTIVDRLARTMGHSREAVELYVLGSYLAFLAPLPFLVQLVVWFLYRERPSYPAIALGTMLVSVLLLLTAFYAYSRSIAALSVSRVARQLWAVRLGHLLGIGLAPVVLRQLTPADVPFNALAVFPVWSLMMGVTFFGLGGRFWGGLYLVGFAFFGLAVLMALRVEWAALEFTFLMAVSFLALSLYMRRLRDEADKEAG